MQMGQALYRKYRSKSLDEIVGQPHITTTLSNALNKVASSHAYLFTGPRGTGKTSIARILAHQVNDLPYSSDETHLDIIEIDAASNRRIDEIRELRERVHSAPTSAKYKVYIIDEVHMLTKEAFNALLKTLEEPPAHVIFVLATTEAHKLPETIVSRTQRFTLKPVNEEQVIAHLRHIATAEAVDISDDALQLIAQHGGGSFRDSIGLLDQLQGHGPSVELHNVQEMLGIAPDQVINELISTLQAGSTAGIITQLALFREQGYSAAQIAKQLAGKLRSYLIEGTSPLQPELITSTLQLLLAVPAAHDPEASLELALIDVVLRQGSQTITPTAAPVVTTRSEPAVVPAKSRAAKIPDAIQQPKPTEMPEPTPAEPEAIQKPMTGQPLDTDVWEQALLAIKKSNNTLYSVARMATPQIDGDELILGLGFAFHQKRLNEVKNKQILADIIENLIGKPIVITCIITQNSAPKAAAIEPLASTATTPDTLSTISNIFGGAEVLES